MKISCDIIRDLLPLYAENMTSQASSEMVETHLGECEGCTNYLKELRTPARLPEQITVQNLNHIKKEIGKRRLLAVLTAVFLMLSLVAGICTFLDAEIYLSAQQAIDHVEQMEDGSVRVYWRYTSRGCTYNKDREDFSEPGNWGMLMHKKRSELLSHKGEVSPEMIAMNSMLPYDTFGEAGSDFSDKDNFWYVNFQDGTAGMLLRDGGAEKPAEGYVFTGANNRFAWYCVNMAVLGIAFALAAWVLRGRRAGKFVRYFALFFGCVCLASVFASGGQFVSHHSAVYRKVTRSVYSLIPMLLTGYFAFELWDMSHPLPSRECTTEKLAGELNVKRCVFQVLTAVLVVASLGVGVYSFLNVATLYMSADEAIVGVRELENGDIQLESAPCMGNMGTSQSKVTGELHFDCVKRVLSYRLLGKRPQTVIGGRTIFKADQDDSYWYLNPRDGTPDKLLWGEESRKPEEPLMTKNFDLAWYCLAMGVCSILLLVLSRFLPGVGKYLRYGALAFGSLCLAALVISGGEFYKFDDELRWRIQSSIPAAVTFFLTGLSVMKLKELEKQDTM